MSRNENSFCGTLGYAPADKAIRKGLLAEQGKH